MDALVQERRDETRAARACAPAVDRAGLIVALAAALAVLALFWGRQVNRDVAWYLVATRDWLDGARLYIDLVEVNPPLNFYFTVPALLLGDLTGAGPQNGQYLLLALLLAVSLVWCGNILAARPAKGRGRDDTVFLAVTALALIVPFFDAMAQREHLMLILILPWLVAYAALGDPDRGGWGLVRAAVAGLGICLKPYFLAYPLALTLWQVWRQRSFRPILARGNMVMLAVGLSYLVYVAAVHPAYFLEVVPVASRVYGAYTFGDAAVRHFFQPESMVLVAIVVLLAARGGATSRPVMVWAAAILAASVSYAAQWTGFLYQAVPIHALSIMACGWIVADRKQSRLTASFAALAALMLLTVYLFSGRGTDPVVDRLTATLRSAGATGSIATLSTGMSEGSPTALALGARWALRYPALWVVPGAVNGLERIDCAAAPERCAPFSAIAATARANTMDDLLAAEPGALIIEDRPRFFVEPGFRWEAFMSQDPRWAAFRAEYRVLDDVAGFTVLVRE